MDSFFDTNIIIKYIEYNYNKEVLRKKCFDYIALLKDKIFISFIVKDEALRVIIKRKEIYENVLKKLQNPNYVIDYSRSAFLNKSDARFAEVLYLKLKGKNRAKLKEDFNSEIDFLNVALASFIKNKVNKISIKKDELDNKIISILNDFIEDFADCRILASAIQMQQEKEQFLFVTADRHIGPGEYDFIEKEIRLKEFRKPKLKNFLFEED